MPAVCVQVGVLPARYDSSRFPGKPLVPILGKPMILRTYEQVGCVGGWLGRSLGGWLAGWMRRRRHREHELIASIRLCCQQRRTAPRCVPSNPHSRTLPLRLTLLRARSATLPAAGCAGLQGDHPGCRGGCHRRRAHCRGVPRGGGAGGHDPPRLPQRCAGVVPCLVCWLALLFICVLLCVGCCALAGMSGWGKGCF